jgi:hypothetical protein
MTRKETEEFLIFTKGKDNLDGTASRVRDEARRVDDRSVRHVLALWTGLALFGHGGPLFKRNVAWRRVCVQD